jgi:hypothetical protein
MNAEDELTTWQTDRAKLLDSPEFINATIQALNGAVPGTGKPYDARKVSGELLQMLFAELNDQHGVHAETALATLGALAGFAVQMALREGLVKPGKAPEDKVFVVTRTKTGESFYFGDLVIEGLFGGKPEIVYFVYSLVGSGAQQAGAKQPPDIKDIVRYVFSTFGSDKFGIPRVPAEHMPRTRPIALLDRFWNPTRNFMVPNVQSPSQWPLVLGLAAQRVILLAKDSIDPALACRLVMETATAMATIDPARIRYAYFEAR